MKPDGQHTDYVTRQLTGRCHVKLKSILGIPSDKQIAIDPKEWFFPKETGRKENPSCSGRMFASSKIEESIVTEKAEYSASLGEQWKLGKERLARKTMKFFSYSQAALKALQSNRSKNGLELQPMLGRLNESNIYVTAAKLEAQTPFTSRHFERLCQECY